MAALRVLGTSSWAGKSLLTTALCRWFAREGVRVAPFKAQNMSNNARVVDGGEIGAAQYFQALAAGIEPDTRLNPVLLKPETDERSQVVVRGRPHGALTRTPWRDRAPLLRPVVEEALASLERDFELVLIEGAGSPAEINLTDIDLANYAAGANAVVVTDVGRGGAFAHLYGTWALLDLPARSRIGGFVFNRFRGDPDLLAAGPRDLERLTGVPTLGVLPELDHGLPDEDGAGPPAAAAGARPRIAVIRYPTASNLDEFRALEQVADVSWVRQTGELANPALIVLPGSKEPLADLGWLRERGLDEAIHAAARAGGRVLGVCGGLQLLGARVGEHPGLGLLPVTTEFTPAKLTRLTKARFERLDSPWTALSGLIVEGYEIREGHTRPQHGGVVSKALPDGLGYTRRNVLGVYLHGLFEDAEVVGALLGTGPQRTLDETFDVLADAVERNLDVRRVRSLAQLGPSAEAPVHPPAMAAADAPRSLVLVNTGDGKGKSTAAFGVLLRAVARRGWRACVVQFVKSDRWKVGEEETARRLGVNWVKGGDGFSWESRDLATSEQLARDAWQQARAAIAAGEHQLVVLDEVTYPINWGWIDGDDVAEVIRGRPARVNVIATGRDAPPVLVDVADTVTEMVKIRHAYDRGVKARRGLDF